MDPFALSRLSDFVFLMCFMYTIVFYGSGWVFPEFGGQKGRVSLSVGWWKRNGKARSRDRDPVEGQNSIPLLTCLLNVFTNHLEIVNSV